MHSIRDKLGKVSLSIPNTPVDRKVLIDIPEPILKLHKSCGGLGLSSVGQKVTSSVVNCDTPRLVRKVFEQPKDMPRAASQLNAALVFGKYQEHMEAEDIGKVARGVHQKMIAGELDDDAVGNDYTSYSHKIRGWLEQFDLKSIIEEGRYPTSNKLIRYSEFVANIKLDEFQQVQLETASERKIVCARNQSSYELSRGDVIVQLRNGITLQLYDRTRRDTMHVQ